MKLIEYVVRLSNANSGPIKIKRIEHEVRETQKMFKSDYDGFQTRKNNIDRWICEVWQSKLLTGVWWTYYTFDVDVITLKSKIKDELEKLILEVSYANVKLYNNKEDEEYASVFINYCKQCGCRRT